MSRIDASLSRFLIKPLVFINLIVARWHKIMNWGACWIDITTLNRKKKDKNRWSKWSQLMQFLQQNILAWPEIPPNFHMEFKTSDLQNLLLTTEICLYPVRCSLSCSGMRLTSFMAEKSRTPHQLKVPLGFVTGRLQPVFQNSSWTLNDTLCEVYGWFISLWGSKHCTAIAILHVEQRRKILQ